MELIKDIHLTFEQMAFLLILYGAFALYGHPEYLLGVYLSSLSWVRSVLFGPISQTWVLMAAMVAASAIYICRSGRFKFLPSQGCWFAFWMGLWWIWMFVLMLCMDDLNLQWILLRTLLCFTIAPIIILLIFSHDFVRVRGLVIAYIITTICAGIVTLNANDISINYLWKDPLLTQTGIHFLGIYNYHFFGQMFAIAIILTTAFYFEKRQSIMQFIILIIISFLGYFLYNAGARDSIVGLLLSLSLLIFWALLRLPRSLVSFIIIMSLIILLSGWFYQNAPHILTRSDVDGLSESASLSTSQRLELWAEGLKNFASSPLWGTGFDKYIISHNFFIGVLADQGLIGLMFLSGFMVFFAQLSCSVWTDAGTSSLSIWRMAFWCIAFFSLFHAQFNGSIVSSYELYWSVVLMWSLGSSDEELKSVLYTNTKVLSPDNFKPNKSHLKI